MLADNSAVYGLGSRLRELDLVLPPPPKPLGHYVEATRFGLWLFISGTLPIRNGRLVVTGRLGENLSVAQGREASRLASLNALAAAQQYLGDISRIKKLLKLTVHLVTTDPFFEHAAVADGASDLFDQLFGPENGHVRMVTGAQSLPNGTPVVVETIFVLQ